MASLWAGGCAGFRTPRGGRKWFVGGAIWMVSGGAMSQGKSSIPYRWTNYLPLGKRIPGTRFIAFKVPLKKTFEWRLAPHERFSPLDLINQIREQREELGLIIDLTNTTRYYEPEELPDRLQHCKIFTVGHEVPNNKIVIEFQNVVKQFLMENQHNDKLIGVHCTHGLNRTGYLICKYLIDVEGMDPNRAIELFNRCRGHCIERKNYIADLTKVHHRSHHTAILGGDWMIRPAYNSDFQAADYNPQNLQQHAFQEERFSPAGRERRDRQSTYRRSNQNLITCYEGGQSVYRPWHPPAPNNVWQSRRRNHEWLYSPYQPHLQERGPSFPVRNPHYPLQQGKYNTDQQSSQNFY